MRFLDQAKIYIKAGNGGNGCISFRREKYIEFGGPNGGNGGDGASVYFEADPSLNTLIDFRYRQHFKAQEGEHGKGTNRFGKKGNDLIIKVPLNTIIWNHDKTIQLAVINNDNPKFLIAEGGKGGRGNTSFKSSINRAPKIAESGTEGLEIWVWLELQLLADIGLVGMPNAGKSTFLSIVSKATPKIADYPFSTLIPQLGVVTHNNQVFTIADIPGLIKGASDGKGLGLRFLSHLNKCVMLLHLIDATSENYYKTFNEINQELFAYNPNFKDKPQIVLINKIDKITPQDLDKKVASLKRKIKNQVFMVSCVNKINIDTVLNTVIEFIDKSKHSHANANNQTPWSPV